MITTEQTLSQRWRQLVSEQLSTTAIAKGRRYANRERLVDIGITPGMLIAEVEGNRNGYFGLFEVPYYYTGLKLKPLLKRQLMALSKVLEEHPDWLTQLWFGSWPLEFGVWLDEQKIDLLPAWKSSQSRCQCLSPEFPCKHVAGLALYMGSLIEQEPLSLLGLRGLEMPDLQEQLEQNRFARLMLARQEAELLNAIPCYLPDLHAEAVPTKVSPQEFWGAAAEPAPLPALAPPRAWLAASPSPLFWQGKRNFETVLDDIHGRLLQRWPQLNRAGEISGGSGVPPQAASANPAASDGTSTKGELKPQKSARRSQSGTRPQKGR